MGSAELEQVADELYGLPPNEFTAARNTRVAEAKANGLPEAADAIKRFRKPTIGAWVVNALVRARPAEVRRLVDVGMALRAAQDQLAGEDLRRLSQERQDVVAALAGQAGQLARAAGHPVSDAVLDEVVATLDAALAEPDAAASLLQGRMTTTLERSGFDLASAALPAASVPATTQARSRQRGSGPDAERAAADAARRYEASTRERHAAEKELAAIDKKMAEAEQRLQDLRLRRHAAAERLRDARAQEDEARRGAAKSTISRRR